MKTWFQSLIGRLKTYVRKLRQENAERRFQSLIGRLKTERHHVGSGGRGDVSIPHR